MKRHFFPLIVFVSLGILLLAAMRQKADPGIQVLASLNSSSPAQNLSPLKIDMDFGKMPLYFIANQGQMDSRVGYYIQGKDKTLYFTPQGVTIALNRSKKSREKDGSGRASELHGKTGLSSENAGALEERLRKGELPESAPPERWVVKLDFVGANRDAKPVGVDKSEALISYFEGKREDWKTGLPTFSKIVYSNLWPGIDLVYSGSMKKLKYEFIVHPGADPSSIRLAYRGVTQLSVTEDGRLEVMTLLGGFHDDIPAAFQEDKEKRVGVTLAYKLDNPEPETGSDDLQAQAPEERTYEYGFDVGPYNRTLPLILDPAILVYCGYIGGSSSELGYGIAVDGSGNAYVTGSTGSTEDAFPVGIGPDLIYNGGTTDAFVAKVNSSGTGLLYCGYIGGDNSDEGYGIALDGSGNAYVIGYTCSTEATFPVAFGPDLTHNGFEDAFVAKVNSSGTSLLYCGYIGGYNYDRGYGIAVDSDDNVYVTGYTGSAEATSFPVLYGPDLTHNGGDDAFVAKVDSSGSGLLYCGYIGGNSTDYGYGIAVDSNGNAYVTGYTGSTEDTFPVGVGPDLTHNSPEDAFVAKVNSSGTCLLYCGYIGGDSTDVGYGIAVDSSGNAYVTGYTGSTEATFPVVFGPDLTSNGYYDAFVAKVNSSGADLLYCGYIGGDNIDEGYGIAVDSSGNAYVTGYTGSSEATFPIAFGPDLTYNGFGDAFVAKANSSGRGLLYCGYIGGYGTERGHGIAVDGSGNACVTGYTTSTEITFPVAFGPDLTHNGGIEDAFVAKIFRPNRDDFVGTWEGQGVYFQNSKTGHWVKLASPADLITAGDLDGDGRDDLIGIWPGKAGVWVRYSKTGAWAKLSTTAKHIGAGDMNGDGRVDLLGTWDGLGVYYRDSISTSWVKLASPATLITTGDVDGDNINDLIGIWPTQGGVWVKYSKTATWARLSTSARDIATGDMNADGREDLVGTWDGQGVYYRDSLSGLWVRISIPGEQITAGDLDGDGVDDLIGLWTGQGGIWVKSSKTGAWSKLSTPAKDICAGAMTGAIWGSGKSRFIGLRGPAGGYAEGPMNLLRYYDLANEGPGGWRFAAQEEKNLIPQAIIRTLVIPGPGEPGFTYVEQTNLLPQAAAGQARERGGPHKKAVGKLKG